jgi:hypothetical protein
MCLAYYLDGSLVAGSPWTGDGNGRWVVRAVPTAPSAHCRLTCRPTGSRCPIPRPARSARPARDTEHSVRQAPTERITGWWEGMRCVRGGRHQPARLIRAHAGARCTACPPARGRTAEHGPEGAAADPLLQAHLALEIDVGDRLPPPRRAHSRVRLFLRKAVQLRLLMVPTWWSMSATACRRPGAQPHAPP